MMCYWVTSIRGPPIDIIVLMIIQVFMIIFWSSYHYHLKKGMISSCVTSIRGPPIDIIVLMSVFLIWYWSLVFKAIIIWIEINDVQHLYWWLWRWQYYCNGGSIYLGLRFWTTWNKAKWFQDLSGPSSLVKINSNEATLAFVLETKLLVYIENYGDDNEDSDGDGWW